MYLRGLNTVLARTCSMMGKRQGVGFEVGVGVAGVCKVCWLGGDKMGREKRGVG